MVELMVEDNLGEELDDWFMLYQLADGKKKTSPVSLKWFIVNIDRPSDYLTIVTVSQLSEDQPSDLWQDVCTL